ncbi:MAG: preprotein translocase subunit YajC [Syntrophomonadaceae bacterium]|jgi:preprotein translocase subunit YajC
MENQPLAPMLLYLAAFIGIFYVFLIMPRKKEEKRHKALLESLQKGDKVITIGGIIGICARIKDDSVIVKVNENTEIEFRKQAIAFKAED